MTPTSLVTTATAAATATGRQASPQPALQTGFAGDEFSNNLFSDLAPLLTLFGEQVTKQFLSMSMGWADNILLGMGPLGILTIVVSAIRVGGVRRLKALIGRARESQVTAEQEILSSTSNDVCELWNGREIVRLAGNSKTKELVVYHREGRGVQVADLSEAIEAGCFQPSVSSLPDGFEDQAPNISLNVDAASSRSEVRFWATIGTVLQSAALAFPAITTYVWTWPKGMRGVAGYAYPFFLAGSCALTAGIILCSHVVEAVTVERNFLPCDDPTQSACMILHVQMGCTIGDQKFPTCLLYSPGNKAIRTSRLETPNPRRLSLKAIFATVLTMTGFIGQFIGLRALHWSATIVQLGVTLCMTSARCWVRRAMAHNPAQCSLPDDPDEASLRIGFLLLKEEGPFDEFDAEFSEGGDWTTWEIPAGMFLTPDERGGGTVFSDEYAKSIANIPEQSKENWKVREHDPQTYIRGALTKFCPIPEPITNLGIRLKCLHVLWVNTVLVNDHQLFQFKQGRGYWSPLHNIFVWRIPVSTYRRTNDYTSRTTHDSTKYSVYSLEVRPDTSYLSSILALWIWSIDRIGKDLFTTGFVGDVYDGQPLHSDFQFLRIVGDCAGFKQEHLLDLRDWIGRSIFVTLKPDGKSILWPLVNHKVYHWPIFGMHTLSPKDQAETSDTNLQALHRVSEDSKSGFIINKADAIEYGDDPNVNGYWNVKGCVTTDAACLAVLSALPVADQCALDILANYMEAVAEAIQDIYAPTILCEPNEAGRRFSNPFFDKMAQALLEQRLVLDLSEAYAIVIPPFLRRGLPHKYDSPSGRIYRDEYYFETHPVRPSSTRPGSSRSSTPETQST